MNSLSLHRSSPSGRLFEGTYFSDLSASCLASGVVQSNSTSRHLNFSSNFTASTVNATKISICTKCQTSGSTFSFMFFCTSPFDIHHSCTNNSKELIRTLKAVTILQCAYTTVLIFTKLIFKKFVIYLSEILKYPSFQNYYSTLSTLCSRLLCTT